MALRARHLLIVLTIGALAASCSSGDDTAGEDTARPLIMVTTSILGDVVGSLVAEDATVEVLIPRGVDPHDFEVSARQAGRLRDADVVVVNGLGLEANLQSAIASAEADGAVVVAVGELVEPLAYDGRAGPTGDHDHDGEHHHDDDHDHDDEHHHDHGSVDPHYWHDPVRMAAAIPELADALLTAAPELDRQQVDQRADRLVSELLNLDAEIAEILAPIPEERRYLLTNHDTLRYFADRYGFEVIGAVIAGGDTQARPGAGALATLVAEIERYDLPAIFADNVVDPGVAEALAAEVGAEVEVVRLYTDSLGEAGSGADTYRGMLLTNARLVADALAG